MLIRQRVQDRKEIGRGSLERHFALLNISFSRCASSICDDTIRPPPVSQAGRVAFLRSRVLVLRVFTSVWASVQINEVAAQRNPLLDDAHVGITRRIRRPRPILFVLFSVARNAAPQIVLLFAPP